MMPSSSSGRTAGQNQPRGTPSAAARAHLRLVAGTAVRRPTGDADRNLVWDAVAQLSEQHRAMLSRSYYLGRTTTQIAAELNTDDAAVKNGLHHALHALRATLGSAAGPLVQ